MTSKDKPDWFLILTRHKSLDVRFGREKAAAILLLVLKTEPIVTSEQAIRFIATDRRFEDNRAYSLATITTPDNNTSLAVLLEDGKSYASDSRKPHELYSLIFHFTVHTEKTTASKEGWYAGYARLSGDGQNGTQFVGRLKPVTQVVHDMWREGHYFDTGMTGPLSDGDDLGWENMRGLILLLTGKSEFEPANINQDLTARTAVTFKQNLTERGYEISNQPPSPQPQTET